MNDQHRFFNPPQIIPQIGHKLERNISWSAMQKQLKLEQILVGCFKNNVLADVAAHIYSSERMEEIEKLYKPIDYYAVNVSEIPGFSQSAADGVIKE